MLLSGTVQAAEESKPSLARLEECRSIRDRVARLACFDRTADTPPDPTVPPAPRPEISPSPAKGPVRELALEQERGRNPDQTDWMIRMRPWREKMFLSPDAYTKIVQSTPNQEPKASPVRHQWTPTTVDVFLTMPEADVSSLPERTRLDEKAILVISCENDITSLYATLPKPITDARTKVSLVGDRGMIFRLNWRDVESGDVISAGRGLESIDVIKSIASLQRLQMQINYEKEVRSFVFDTANLRERLEPLRTACHW